MKIAPRYDAEPLIRLDGPLHAVGAPFLRQRRRMARTLASLTPDRWVEPSRCEGWRVQDVVAHLTGTDQFWSLSIASGLAGTPTRVLGAFDPKTTPAAMVDAVRDAPPREVLARYRDASEALCSAVERLDGTGWQTIAESPAGDVTISALVHHALWDSWIHERDVVVPLGLEQPREADEIIASLRYAAAISAGFAVQAGTAEPSTLALVVEHPSAHAAITVTDHVMVTDVAPPEGACTMTGDAVDLLEAISVRASWPDPVPDSHAWMVMGLAAVFESTAPA